MDSTLKKYKAIIASPGIAQGKVHVFTSYPRNDVPRYSIAQKNTKKEIQRFFSAVDAAKNDFYELKEKDVTKSTHDIIESYVLMLGDNEFHAKITEIITNKLYNAEWATYDVMQEYINLLEYSEQRYLREREYDLNEIIALLISHLTLESNEKHVHEKKYANLEKPCIIVARSLSTSEFLRFPKEKILGITIELGGINSHVCLIAKSYGIPMLVGVQGLMHKIENNSNIILDANEGYIICNADKRMQQQYEEYSRHYDSEVQEVFQEARTSQHKTLDGTAVEFFLNFELVEEMKKDIIELSDGVGLLRTEFLFPISKSYLNEEHQLHTYTKILTTMSPKTVTIRTFDVGGDKMQEYLHNHLEENPLMGLRGVRFTLFHKEIMLSQLRAILTASHYGKIRILVPMISILDEWKIFLDLLAQAKSMLDKRSIPYDTNIQVGPMIEVPSILYQLEELAKTSDFWSIGSNDLLQFLFAADRTNPNLEYLYQSTHPSFLSMLRDIFHYSYEYNIDITLCGEIASDKIMIPLLLGAGLRNFSVTISQLPRVITRVKMMKIDDTRSLFEESVRSSNTNEVLKKVKEYLIQLKSSFKY